MMACMRKFNSDLTALGDRIDHLEDKMGEYATTINNVIDAHDTVEDQNLFKAKPADLEEK